MVAFLVLETMMVGMFAALDMLVFYVFFEGVLIPMFLIIGVWGGARRVYAAYKFFLYTLLGSVLMLLAILYLWREAGTTDIPTLIRHAVPRPRRPGSSSPSWPPSRSRCRCGPSTPGCRTRTWRRRPPAPSSSPACC
jgi:NADH:ubiquinone oxidoreductase subunit 5 (subunit L)/multisubunit Na+/H+ antiporter MnhA subunit